MLSIVNKNKSLYKTQSLIIAATLLSLDTPLESIEKDFDGKSTFIFCDTATLNQTVKSFWEKSLLIEPNMLWEQLRFLKSRIYGG